MFSKILTATCRRMIPVKFRPAVKGFVARFAAPTITWDREAVANKYLAGAGLEIGALHAPLRVPTTARVKYVDRMSATDLRQHYPELESLRLVDTDIIDDGELLRTVQDASQDFVIANHFIEHCQNPLLALRNMFRVLKLNGILYLAIPDKRFTFDIERPITSLEHIFKDYEEGPEWSRLQHFEEWVRLVDKVVEDLEVAKRLKELIDRDYSIHFHVWTQTEMHELILALSERMGFCFDIELFLKNADEGIFILKKNGLTM